MLFLSSYRDTIGSLGEQEMLWKHELTGRWFQSFFEFSQTSICVCVKQLDYELKISITHRNRERIVSSPAACAGGHFFVLSKCLWRGLRLKFWTTTVFVGLSRNIQNTVCIIHPPLFFRYFCLLIFILTLVWLLLDYNLLMSRLFDQHATMT